MLITHRCIMPSKARKRPVPAKKPRLFTRAILVLQRKIIINILMIHLRSCDIEHTLNGEPKEKPVVYEVTDL